MSKSVTVRKAQREDIPAIQRVAAESWHDTYDGLIPRDIQDTFISQAYSEENMKARIEHTYLFVAETADGISGFANFSKKDKEEAELGALYIEPGEQGKGIGTKLLQAGIAELGGVSRVMVEVESGNNIGESFYKARGFLLVGEFDENFYGHYLKTKRMVLHL